MAVAEPFLARSLLKASSYNLHVALQPPGAVPRAARLHSEQPQSSSYLCNLLGPILGFASGPVKLTSPSPLHVLHDLCVLSLHILGANETQKISLTVIYLLGAGGGRFAG